MCKYIAYGDARRVEYCAVATMCEYIAYGDARRVVYCTATTMCKYNAYGDMRRVAFRARSGIIDKIKHTTYDKRLVCELY